MGIAEGGSKNSVSWHAPVRARTPPATGNVNSLSWGDF
jgi:hypothetical protein